MKPVHHTPRALLGLRDIAADYDAILCDIWGVMHDGLRAFAGVEDALNTFRDSQKKPVLLLTNAPRPYDNVERRLLKVGIKTRCYDKILTSGDLTRTLVTLRGKAGEVCHFVGPESDKDLIDGLDIRFSACEGADFILLSGLYDASCETPEDYREQATIWREKNLPLICANPDHKVQMGDRDVYCAGAIAALYEAMGGDVIWVGKPHAPSYDQAKAMLSDMTGKQKPHILAIGDGPLTDIAGANKAGLDVLFITGGLMSMSAHAHKTTPQGITDFLSAYGVHAAYSCAHLMW